MGPWGELGKIQSIRQSKWLQKELNHLTRFVETCRADGQYSSVGMPLLLEGSTYNDIPHRFEAKCVGNGTKS